MRPRAGHLISADSHGDGHANRSRATQTKRVYPIWWSSCLRPVPRLEPTAGCWRATATTMPKPLTHSATLTTPPAATVPLAVPRNAHSRCSPRSVIRTRNRLEQNRAARDDVSRQSV